MSFLRWQVCIKCLQEEKNHVTTADDVSVRSSLLLSLQLCVDSCEMAREKEESWSNRRYAIDEKKLCPWCSYVLEHIVCCDKEKVEVALWPRARFT